MIFLYHAGSNWTPREGGGAHLDRCHCETLTLSPPAPALSSSRPHTVSSAPPVNEKKNKKDHYPTWSVKQGPTTMKHLYQ